MIRLLEEKITKQGRDCYPEYVEMLPLSKILIKNKSPIISDFLAYGVKKYTRKLNFDEFQSAMYALKASYHESGNATKLK